MEAVLAKISELGLPLAMDKITPGDGNCFLDPRLQREGPMNSLPSVRLSVCP